MSEQSETRYCFHPHIETLLELDNHELLQVSQTHPQGVVAIRKSLVLQQIQGVEYLAGKKCGNVDPSGNCLGHPA